MGNVSPTPRQLLTEECTYYQCYQHGNQHILRRSSRISRSIAAGSVKRLSFDDYVMTATFMIYTSLLILIQVSSRHGTNLFPTEETQQILSDPQQVRDRIYGSKIVIGLEQCMLFSTWGVKICMLSLFWRLTANIRFLHLYVKAIAVYVAVGFVVIMVTYFGVYCRPFEQYWQLPVENIQCATYQHYSITQAVFNISSDAAMLVVPVPLLMKTQLKARRKFILVCIMSLGVFTIFAAILNKVYNFLSPLTTMYQIWYIREASTAIYVANLICLWPLLRKLFGLKAFQFNSKHYRHHGAHLIKESPGASQSPGTTVSSQSRPSFSIPRLHLSRLGSGRTVQNVVHKGSDEMHPSPEATNKMSLTRLDTKEATHQEKKGLGEPGPTTLETHASYDLEAGDIGHIDYHSSLKFG
ncbi:hypothetical protein F9C07_4817 [Aspergillus flavus]|uniref:Rhodopsin domain-containing protein n=1 Tax=Aspergillus flavus (strain ATCC 200026 / FGSC A1120 / IAM 13836 / NRRL 3357 / JCM 12722 / SRRC 167) TaxID=332952 RepID=A0A7U2QUU4_ASPFN|nr:hypothetical protein F9C07_4817 [Aspergillus flavus]